MTRGKGFSNKIACAPVVFDFLLHAWPKAMNSFDKRRLNGFPGLVPARRSAATRFRPVDPKKERAVSARSHSVVSDLGFGRPTEARETSRC